ncbi:prolow-density lipoprotein receptor-related protein 1-like [Brevipalpus obovatus]|uniref:prolow-density lipoprotein receptor-related protein 1-like n=1 Tax=Brevipalpus obovatus TaxID=246614 RepID=UPI003D9E8CA8
MRYLIVFAISMFSLSLSSSGESNECQGTSCSVHPECDTNQFTCHTNGECISKSATCDGKVDCSDGSDENQFCYDPQMSCKAKSCSHYCQWHGNDTGNGGHNQTTCLCGDGYELSADDRTCRDINECDLSPLSRPCFQECINSIGGYRCDCFDDYHLDDGNRCVPSLGTNLLCRSSPIDPFLFKLTTTSTSCTLQKYYFDCIDRVSRVYDLPIPIDSFTYNWQDEIIYGYYSAKRRIVSIDLKNLTKSYQTLVKFKKIRQPISGLKYDPYTKNLLWLMPGEGILQILPLGMDKVVVPRKGLNKYIMNLTRGVENGHQVEVNPNRDEIYITIWGLEPKIMVTDLDGSNLRPIEEVKRLGRATSITVQIHEDHSRLYWLDGVHGTLNYLDLSGPKAVFGQQFTVRSDLRSIRSMIVHKEIMYLMDNDNSLYQAPIYRSLKKPTLVHKSSNNNNGPKNMHLTYVVNANHTSPCLNGNFNCSHLCLMLDQTPVCKCPQEYSLDEDDRTCKKMLCNFDEILCTDGRECFKKVHRCDSKNDCSDGSDEANCPKADRCGVGQRPCDDRDGPCIPERWFCDGYSDCPGRTDEQNCETRCSSSEFDCGDLCISKRWVCDSIQDCPNGKDEENCIAL